MVVFAAALQGGKERTSTPEDGEVQLQTGNAGFQTGKCQTQTFVGHWWDKGGFQLLNLANYTRTEGLHLENWFLVRHKIISHPEV